MSFAGRRRAPAGPADISTSWTGTDGDGWPAPWIAKVTTAGSSSTIAGNRGRIKVGGTTTPPPSGTTTAYATLGTYHGASSPSRIAQFESSEGINRAMPGPIVDFPAPGTSWSQRRSALNAFLNAWAPRCVAGTDTLAISPRPWWDDPAKTSVNMATAATGAYDSEYVADAQSILNAGYSAANVIIRPMWEFNGGFYQWSIWTSKNGAAAPSNFVSTFRRIVNAMRSVIPGLRFEWCPLRLTARTPAEVEAAYPGDSYVDYIGLDAYNHGAATMSNTLRWTQLVQGGSTPGALVGLQWQRDFAATAGKLCSFPEWGCTHRDSDLQGGDDDAYYVSQLITWIDQLGADGLLAYHAYFEKDAQDGWHQLHDYAALPRKYAFVNALAAFDSRMRG